MTVAVAAAPDALSPATGHVFLAKQVLRESNGALCALVSDDINEDAVFRAAFFNVRREDLDLEAVALYLLLLHPEKATAEEPRNLVGVRRGGSGGLGTDNLGDVQRNLLATNASHGLLCCVLPGQTLPGD